LACLCDNLFMEKVWTDAKILYFHFLTNSSEKSRGCAGIPASLPMHRVLQAFAAPFKGIPGTVESLVHGRKAWVVPGYKCLNCAKTFFSADRDGLKHECMGHGGIISESSSMGI